MPRPRLSSDDLWFQQQLTALVKAAEFACPNAGDGAPSLES